MIEVVHIVARVTTDMTRFNAGMASMEARAKTATAKMSLAGMRMTKYLTLPIAAIGYGAIKTATSFQSATTQIQTQAGALAKDMPRIRKALLAMAGKDVIQGPVDLANAYYHLQSVMGNTKTVAEKMNILKSVAHLAQIGHASMEDTGSAVAGIMRTGIRGAQNVGRVVATINGIIGSGNMRMAQFVESTGTAVLQTATLAGLSLREVGAAEAVFTDENMNANMAMTRFRTGLMMLAHPSSVAIKALKEFHLTSQQLGTESRTKGFGAMLQDLKQHYKDFIAMKVASGMSLKAAQQMAFGLLGASFGGSKTASTWMTLMRQANMFGQKMDQIKQKSKSFNKDLAADSKTMSAQFRSAWSRIQVALIHFGDALAPVVLGAAKEISKLADAFSSLPKWAQKWLMGVALGLAALGPVLIVASSLIKIFGDLGMLFRAGGMLSVGFSSILPLAIIAAVGALVYFALKSKTFRAWLLTWGKQIQAFFHWLGFDVIGPFFHRLYNWWSEGGKASRWNTIVIPALRAAGHAFKTIGKDIVKVLQHIAGAIEAVIKKGQQLARWSYGLGEGLAGIAQALGLSGKMPMPHFTKRGQAALGKLQAQAAARGETVDQYLAQQSRRRRHHHHRHHDAAAPLVHIGEMNVRHESDAEIVAARIARRVMIA